MYIDSHAHLSSDELFSNREEVQKKAKEALVDVIINICTDEKTLTRGLLLKQHYSNIFLTASTTPHDVEKEGESFFLQVKQAAQEKHLVAIGETGLDYYYEHSPKELQKAFLLRYFHLAKETNLPLIFHCRDAFEDLFSLAKTDYRDGRGLIHCFTGTFEEAKKALDLGWYISFSGIVTFKKSIDLREVAKKIPLSHMMIETDSPYLAPQGKRGQRNEPAFLPETARLLAEIKGVSLEELAFSTKKNALDFFSL